jgi:hypothetical protein
MFDIIHKFNVLLCFNHGRNTINEPIHTKYQCIDNEVLTQHGAPEYPHSSGMQPHNVPTTVAHNGNMVVY